MFKANDNFAILPESYLFSEVARKIREFREANPDKELIRMDIGDVSLPLPAVVVDAMRDAATQMGESAGFHGYGPEQGYEFLRSLIAEHDYVRRGIECIGADDVFVSDGAKSDLGNFTDLFGKNVRIAVAEPGYPVYVDANVLAGRGGQEQSGRWSNFTYIECPASDGFRPSLPNDRADVIYLCYPNNPTGVALTRDELKKWVDFALANNSLIIFDSAYEAYITDSDVPRSIYEIEGAEKVAVEIRSFSKTAGFTGVRCGYTVVPRTLRFTFDSGEPADLNKMWRRRQSTKFNGVGYVVQCAAASLYTPEGKAAVKTHVDYYMRNARLLREALVEKGWEVVGGVNSPYVWFRPTVKEGNPGSWELFQKILDTANLSSTPGVGFGACGEGWLRFTGFNTAEKTLEATRRIKELTL
ncbi:MAG: LL-diaminopimelate aminotransferase [Muribaculaceae bacterium]|nr:LL-diaminopimelate aminotransferase [Muribaculaceae bacterium]